MDRPEKKLRKAEARVAKYEALVKEAQDMIALRTEQLAELEGDDPASRRVMRDERFNSYWHAAERGLAPLAIAFVVGLFWKSGNASADYYVTVAQVAPVLFLAALIEARATGLSAVRRFADDPTFAEVVMYSLRTFVVLFLVAEGTALYAIAADEQSTMLTLAPPLAMAGTLAMMIRELRQSLNVHDS